MLRLELDELFQRLLGLRRLRAEVAEGNDASRRVLEDNGFTATGRQRSARRLRGGGAGDLLCYDLLVEEYRPGKRGGPPPGRGGPPRGAR